MHRALEEAKKKAKERVSERAKAEEAKADVNASSHEEKAKRLFNGFVAGSSTAFKTIKAKAEQKVDQWEVRKKMEEAKAVVEAKATVAFSPAKPKSGGNRVEKVKIENICALGFSAEKAQSALRRTGGDVNAACNFLLEECDLTDSKSKGEGPIAKKLSLTEDGDEEASPTSAPSASSSSESRATGSSTPVSAPPRPPPTRLSRGASEPQDDGFGLGTRRRSWVSCPHTMAKSNSTPNGAYEASAGAGHEERQKEPAHVLAADFPASRGEDGERSEQSRDEGGENGTDGEASEEELLFCAEDEAAARPSTAAEINGAGAPVVEAVVPAAASGPSRRHSMPTSFALPPTPTSCLQDMESVKLELHNYNEAQDDQDEEEEELEEESTEEDGPPGCEMPEVLPPPDSDSWDWPLSRQEKKARVLMLERQVHQMDRSTMMQELVELRILWRKQQDQDTARKVAAA